MLVINHQGVVIYDGAIDDKPTADCANILEPNPAMSAWRWNRLAGKPVETPTQDYAKSHLCRMCRLEYPQAEHC